MTENEDIQGTSGEDIRMPEIKYKPGNKKDTEIKKCFIKTREKIKNYSGTKILVSHGLSYFL